MCLLTIFQHTILIGGGGAEDVGRSWTRDQIDRKWGSRRCIDSWNRLKVTVEGKLYDDLHPVYRKGDFQSTCNYGQQDST